MGKNHTVTKNYEVSEYSTTRFASSIRNILGRLKSILLLALKKEDKLLKAIIIVWDDDIIKQSKVSLSEAHEGGFAIIAKYIFEEIDRLVSQYLEKLPSKAKMNYFPHVIWILPPSHKYFANNEMRELCTESFEAEVQDYPNMCALGLKKVWNEGNGGLYLQNQRRYTPTGLQSYWMAIDAAIRFWDKTLSDIMLKCQKKAAFALPKFQSKFHNQMNVKDKRKFASRPGNMSRSQPNQNTLENNVYKSPLNPPVQGRRLPAPPHR